MLEREAIRYLHPGAGGRFVDGTLGDGGHSERLLRSEPSLEVLGVDRDPATVEATRRRLASWGPRFHAHLGTFDDLGPALASVGWERANGVLLDLGVSSMQLDDPARGFGFRARGPLDMRMTPTAGETAAELVARLDEAALAEILFRYGEEPSARRIARALVARRATAPIATTADLADVVERVVPRRGGTHPATRTFQALRIAVNDELGHLERFLARALEWIAAGGRLVIIAYHSLEDRAVKRTFQAWATACTCPPRTPVCVCGGRARARVLTRKVVTPSADEVAANRRARSARLRAVEILAAA